MPKLPNKSYQTKPVKPNHSNQFYSTRPTEPNLPNQIFQSRPTNPTYLAKLIKPNQIKPLNQNYQIKLIKQNMPNQTYQTKPSKVKLWIELKRHKKQPVGLLCLWQCLLAIQDSWISDIVTEWSFDSRSRLIGPSSQKLRPNRMFGRFPHCNYNVKLQSFGRNRFMGLKWWKLLYVMF